MRLATLNFCFLHLAKTMVKKVKTQTPNWGEYVHSYYHKGQISLINKSAYKFLVKRQAIHQKVNKRQRTTGNGKETKNGLTLFF